MVRGSRSPRTKEELLNKLMSYDFDGDIRTLGENTQVKRVSPQTVSLHFPEIGKTYELTVRIPREDDGKRSIPEMDVEWTVGPEDRPRRRRRAS